MRLWKWFVCAWIGLGAAAPAHGAALTIQLADLGDVAQDVPGWSFSSDARLPGELSLTPLGSLAPRAGARSEKRSAALFRAAWDLAVNIAVLGENARNLGATTALVDRLGVHAQSSPHTLPEPSVSLGAGGVLAGLVLARRRGQRSIGSTDEPSSSSSSTTAGAGFGRRGVCRCGAGAACAGMTERGS